MRIKRKLLVCCMAILLVASVFGTAIGTGACVEENDVGDAYPSGGSVVDNPIEIYNWYELDDVRNNLDADYVLMNDLDENTNGYHELASENANELNDRGEWQESTTYELNDLVKVDEGGWYDGIYYCIKQHESSDNFESSYWVRTEKEDGEALGWEPIGEYRWWIEIDDPFNGTFDGNGYEIKGLYINRSEGNYVGLFGYAKEGAHFTDIGVIDAEVRGRSYVGVLVGDNSGTIDNSYAAGSVRGNREYVGGLVGINRGTVSKSYATVTVSGDHWYVGGLVGTNTGIMENSYATGTVSGPSRLGGLVGWNYLGRISGSYATGDVSGGSKVGGLVGRNGGFGLDSPISNSYATGDVSGEKYVGGLVGRNLGSTIFYLYATGDVSGDERVGGLVGSNHESALSDSYATGDVNGNSLVGGLVGFNRESTVKNSHYNIDTVEINGDHHVTLGGLFDEQFQDWIEDKNLDIADYSDTLVPSGDYYEIDSIDGLRDLLGFSGREGYKFRLVSDIDLSGAPGLYIPYLAADFHGQEHIISDLHIDMSFANNIGMFGFVDQSAEVRNMRVIDADVSGNSGVGALVGYNLEGTISGSYATGDVSGEWSTGGLVGGNEGTVSDSYATGEVSGNTRVGGLVGRNWDGTIFGSYATGDVSGEMLVGGLIGSGGTVKNSYATGDVIGDLSIGGLMGYNEGTVNNSYSTGEVSGEDEVGGLVGTNWGGTIFSSYSTGDVCGINRTGGLVGYNYVGTILSSYAIGAVSGDERVGGLVGRSIWSTVSNSFWNIETSGQDTSASDATGKTTEEMKDVATFTNTDTEGLEEPWDFIGDPYDDEGDEDIWDIDEEINDGYPFFVWNYYYTLDVMIEGEGTVEIDPYEDRYKQGSEVTLTVIPHEGWEFVKWTGDHESEEEQITITMEENKELTIHFKLKTYTLDVEIVGEGDVETYPELSEYEHGMEVDLTAIPGEDWNFVEWTGDTTTIEDTTAETTTIQILDHYTVTAVFELKMYDLTLDIEGEGTVQVIIGGEIQTVVVSEWTREYEIGTEITLSAIPDDDWEFDGWTGDYEDAEKKITIVMNEDKEITAWFAEEEVLEVEEDEDDDTPGFTSALLLIAAIIAVAIYKKKKR